MSRERWERDWRTLIAAALEYPGAWEDHPWGETVVKIGKKVFVFAGVSDEGWGVSLKLPESADFALSMPCCKPTGYGLGKAGWVSVKVRADEVPMDMMLDWLDESYRAVAPKTLVKKLPSGPATQS